MRVPVYPDDLIRNRGFKSLSKQLQERWYGSTPISLADAQKALARGLGYQSFHDLNEASKACSPDAPVPPEADVRQEIRSAIGTTLQLEALLPMDQQKLERLVNDLSLKKLVAFKRMQVSPGAGHSLLSELVREAQPGLTKEHVQTLEKILAESGSFRDRAFFACMLGALRPSEFLSARMQDSAAVYGVKTRDTKRVLNALPDKHRSVFKQYIKASKLSDGEYLFHAANGSGRPLSPDALRKICASWARKANVDASLVTPNSVRKTTDGYADLVRQMSERMGHHSTNTSLAYVAGLPRTTIH
ncbi:site-specific integrase [Pseudomonas syringae]|uniref:site-specific integrase n=1 Tax=Pseudomonas syringae TaxID=317 RepID=UPI0018E633B3|nr:site-specific integrase [Pseudomonas syringae]MBI6750951.1 site-specific integrase [Pseudomonas syringae]MBI6769232.1 site-specific integrase [Pseudomonas syringae]MBI6778551.1 site-specific integrase [Pseudomonas syringae]MBI6793724.1 site-specific integrase [Pseudomonas syringae]MBI6804455.1 site-specific integrase [Pseudomonas syringae]